MNNKFLITVIIPTAEMEFDIYVPNCRKIGTIKKFILSAISDLTDKVYDRPFESVRLIAAYEQQSQAIQNAIGEKTPTIDTAGNQWEGFGE